LIGIAFIVWKNLDINIRENLIKANMLIFSK
jgi:hypothetical protein